MRLPIKRPNSIWKKNSLYFCSMRMEDTICALSTASGMGAIAVIRISGSETFPILSKVYRPFSAKHNLEKAAPYSALFGRIVDLEGELVDEVMVTVFNGPKSYTGEDVIEIACHGSTFIQERILRLLMKAGARMADPGEYTLRAYINGKMDLSQAEAVADLISSENQASHKIALQNMKGGISKEIKYLRKELIDFVSLIELELDFAEEDVEFADRQALNELIVKIESVLKSLIASYDTGNAIKSGVPVAIIGAPNAGKSTLLNALLKEEKAIVTDIAGTTRDAIEDEITIEGINYRFIDTAGIRETEDLVESIGIKKTFEKIEQSDLVLYLIDANRFNDAGQEAHIRSELSEVQAKAEHRHLVLVINKVDALNERLPEWISDLEPLALNAKSGEGLEVLSHRISSFYNWGDLSAQQSIVTNVRHLQALELSLENIDRLKESMAAGLSGDLLSFDIREALQNLGSIIGEVDVDKDILGNIFGKFCIGK